MHAEAYEKMNERTIIQKADICNRLRILIVDDEPKILKGLSLMIENMDRPAAVVQSANGVKVALSAVGSFNPDVVITDICMPGMDGFELIDRLKEISSCNHYIILSGYSDFEYARTAIKKKTMDYLLKPVDEDALQQLLLRVEAELAQERENYYNLKMRMLQDFIFYGTPLNNSFFDKQLEIIFPYPNFLVTVFRGAESLQEDMQENLKQPFYGITPRVEVIKHPKNKIAVILSNLPANTSDADIRLIREELIHIMDENNYESLYAGMSEPDENILQLNKLYHSAIMDSYISQYFSKKCLDDLEKIKCCLKNFFSNIDDIFETGNLQGNHEALTLILEELNPVLPACEDWNSVYSVIKRGMKNMMNEQEDMLKELELLNEINWREQYGAGNAEKMAKSIYRVLSALFCTKQSTDKDMTACIKKMVGYIEANYMKDISLTDMAKFVHMHPKYVSAVFSKSMGKTFLQYLNHYRISKAKDIMAENPDIAQESIALMVGYDNLRNYYKVFKRICNCTPGDYKKRLST
jgi:two-component system response regulator YesN